MSRDTHFRKRKLAPLILATSWCASAALPVYAGKPVDASELPARALPGELPIASSSLIAVADTQQVLPPPVEPSPEAAPAVSTPAPASRPAPSESVTINLINRMVARGLLPKEEADELIKQAEADAVAAREQAAAAQEAAVQTAVQQAVAAAQATAAQMAPSVEYPATSPDDLRVTYIPETVRAQIRDEIKQDVLEEARADNWGVAELVPEWVGRFKLFGDLRVRYEGIFFPNGNDATGAFPNFNAINTGAPYDISGFQFAPQINADQDRHRFRLRARVGAEVNLGEGFTAGLRIATGDGNSPVSTNQSFGLANQGQGGNFSKYAIWLDRAFLKYETGAGPNKLLALSVGRFDNPFFATDIIWDEDLGFDGIGLQARYEVLPGVTPFVNAGAFVVFNTDYNFSSIRPAKFESDDKYLYAGQFGVDWQINKDWHLRLAAAYYHFDNIEGRLSDPFVPLTPEDNGNTDNTRPSFAQKGNTYMALRNIIPNELNNFGTSLQYQYFGLATPFQEIALTGRLDYNGWEPAQISLLGEFVKNVAFDRNDIGVKALNNRGPDSASGAIGSFDGGDTAWIVDLRVGKPAFQKRWDWAVGANYRYVESDAVVDGFADSDFGGGGTNVKGFSLYGGVALGERVWLGVRWMSASEVSGPQYEQDTIQFDINGRF